MTLALHLLGHARVEGIDPFTGDAYRRRTGHQARPLSFEDVAAGALVGEEYSLIVCSYALHLLDRSRLPAVLTQLALIAPRLIVLTPHKRPEISADWGWQLVDEFMAHRTRTRLYRSTLR